MKNNLLKFDETSKVGIARPINIEYLYGDVFASRVTEILNTTYKRRCPHELAPILTDCISSVRYILEASTNLGFGFGHISDIPKILFESGNWELLDSRVDSLQKFDILFSQGTHLTDVPHLAKAFPVSHMGLYYGKNKVLHSSEDKGGVVDNIEEFYDGFYPVLSEKFMKRHL